VGQKLRRSLSGWRMEHSSVNAVGVWFYSFDTQRYLYLMRNDPKNPNTWGLPGGKVESNETLMDTITRECTEELGFMPDYLRLVPLEKFTSTDNVFVYHTFFCCVASEFRPDLNDEHLGYAWMDSSVLPKPMHPGLWNTVNFDIVKQKIATLKDVVHSAQ
jgi:8-oxo-dGTP pyrophosphatase MutT (NUDIX family)